ncbi:unnamed protein product [Blumeria hordei]|uniref:SCP2 domain-containing protein n=2 Tax=Blumeria hordei TaxID=2867405 RepID=A0A383URZ4_BLUHO|nr:oleate induced peroxysomal protein POX8 [Blumeria hordei DH14]SZF02657.1 unnamed protein product [Blumeria hordei]
MSLKNDKFPSSAAFDTINNSFKSSESERVKAIKEAKSVFAFTLKNKAGETESWHIDLLKKGEVGKGLGESPTVTLKMSDEDFGKLVNATEDPQKLFMSGRLGVEGDIMKATKLRNLFKKSQAVKSKL